MIVGGNSVLTLSGKQQFAQRHRYDYQHRTLSVRRRQQQSAPPPPEHRHHRQRATLLANAGFNAANRGIILGGGSDILDALANTTLTISGTVTGGGNLVKGSNAGNGGAGQRQRFLRPLHPSTAAP